MPWKTAFGAWAGRGAYVVTDQRGVERRYGALPGGVNPAEGPCCIAAHIKVPDSDRVAAILAENAVAAMICPEDIRLPDAAAYGNVFLAFSAPGMPVKSWSRCSARNISLRGRMQITGE